jgi:predicted Zn-dependent protease
VDRAGEVPTPATPRIIQNLRNNLEATPGSTIRIREMQFPAFNADDALRIARQYHAAVIIWGVIDDRRTNFNIQLGDYASFGSAKISEATLRRSSDVVQLTTVNPDASSLDTLVLNALRLGYLASDDAYHAAMIQALADKTPVSFDPMLTEMTNQVALAAVLAEAGQPDKALEMLNNAITQDSTNPFSYLYRAEVRHAAKQDVKTADTIANDLRLARQYGAKGWLAPDFIELSFADATNNLEQVVTLAGKILESSPDNWYILTQRATAYLLPYLVAATIATQEGNFPLAQQRTTETKTLGAAGKLVTLAEPRNPSEIEVFHAALVAAALGQNVTALQKLDQALLLQADARIINLQKGLLYCSAENYPDSETTLSNEIKRAPDAYVLFALRAAVRRKQGKIADADADTAEAIKIPNASLKPTLQRMAEGGLSCQALTQPAK